MAATVHVKDMPPEVSESPFDRRTSLGDLGRLPDRLLFMIIFCLQGRELLHCTAGVSWVFHNLSNSEEVWRRLVLVYYIDRRFKKSAFTYKGTWKLTFFKPQRESVLVPLITTNQSCPLPVAGSGNNSSSADASGNYPTLTHQTENHMLVVAVEDFKLQNRHCVNKLLTPRGGEAPRCYHGVKAIPSPKLLGEVTNWQHLHRSYSINHTFGLRLPPPYSTLQPRDSFLTYNVLGADFMKWPMNLNVDRRANLSVEDFRNEYEIPNRPVVMTGMTNTWAARWKWQPDTFTKYYKETLFNCGKGSDGKKFKMSGFDYLAYCTSWNGEKPFYIFDKTCVNPQHVNGRAFCSDFEVPPHFKEDYFGLMSEEDRPDYRWLLVGPSGCGSPFHQDPHGTGAWNAVMTGCKRVSFYPPEIIPPGVDEELINSDYYASDDMMEWYRNTYPTLPAERKPMECLVFPGDVLYIPSMWWHQVLNIGTTIAVTQNTCSPRQFPMVAKEINATGGRGIRDDFRTALARNPSVSHLADQIQLLPPKKPRKLIDTSSDDDDDSSDSSDSD